MSEENFETLQQRILDEIRYAHSLADLENVLAKSKKDLETYRLKVYGKRVEVKRDPEVKVDSW